MRKSADLGIADQSVLTEISIDVVKRNPNFAAKLLVVALFHPDHKA